MSVVPATVVEAGGQSAGTATQSPHFLRRLVRRRMAVVCMTWIAIVILVAIVAPLAMPGVEHENAGNLLTINQGPTSAHLLGTDTLGRDILDRLLVGAGVTILGVAEALGTALLLGVPVGLVAGYFGGWVDRTIGWLVDLGFSMPGIIVALLVLGIFPQSTTAAMITLGVLFTPGVVRIVRSAVLQVREELFIAAARVSGLSRPFIIFRHVLPLIEGVVVVNAALVAASALLAQTGLAFLGLVSPAPAPSWGGMIENGISAIVLQPWLIWPPGVVTVITILAFALLGDAARDTIAESRSGPVASSAARRSRRRGVRPGRLRQRRPARRDQTPTPTPDETPTEALLAIENLNVSFATSKPPVRAVEGVCLEIRRGEALGLVGESGCGKTLTAMSILGLLPGAGAIESGRIIFDGTDLVALSEQQLRRLRGREIGLISQEPMVSLNPVFRVGWQLREAVQQHGGLSRRDASRRVIELLESVGLPEPEIVAKRYPHELSGGMAQRVSIARALAGEPKLLIADEPTTALDVTVQAEILDLLRGLRDERGMAILLVTHDWGVVADICERAVVMYAGQIVESGSVSTLFNNPRHPYTEALLESNPHQARETELLPTIPGTVPRPGEWPLGCHFSSRCRYSTPDCTAGPVALQAAGDEHETRCIHHDEVLASR
jgi:peptide/nickel transport system permease protein